MVPRLTYLLKNDSEILNRKKKHIFFNSKTTKSHFKSQQSFLKHPHIFFIEISDSKSITGFVSIL